MSGGKGRARELIFASMMKERSIADFLESTNIGREIVELRILGSSSPSS